MVWDVKEEVRGGEGFGEVSQPKENAILVCFIVNFLLMFNKTFDSKLFHKLCMLCVSSKYFVARINLMLVSIIGFIPCDNHRECIFHVIILYQCVYCMSLGFLNK